MNTLVCKAKIRENRIVYVYMFEGMPYEIEVPKTHANAGVKDGEIVEVHIAAMPYEKDITIADVVVPCTKE